ncbi:MAG: hypothetical protein JWO79_719 [Actinomycetia bacterium]|jgi:hypothetical protein|nr:hypothetical protein [Actinomycetes bacterium]
MTEIALAIWGYMWLVPLPSAVWLVLKTSTARTVGRILRVCVWDLLMRREGVPEVERLRLIAEAAERDLKSS